ncbi:MAG TPA: helicase-related protein [Methanomassiliicoccaceae archaeon]|nr:helicase-related protein [Methanomassiliicoccaceae archaeon]HQD87812.1 helicase-related protein [Methanomassiliicoccaceae archaeon]
MYVEHALIKPHSVLERGYQTSLVGSCLTASTLLVLPTGLGKTVIAMRVAAEILLKRGGKVLFLAPTRPLVAQTASYLAEHLLDRSVGIMTGESPPRERRVAWEVNDVLVATPQSVSNDLDNGVIDLDDVSLIVYDEAHRAVGNYAYVKVARHNKGALALGMTASPGSTRKRIPTVCANLGLRELEWREEDAEDVAPHVHDVKVEVVRVASPEHAPMVMELLRRLQRPSIDVLVKMRLMKDDRPATVPYLLQVNKAIESRMRQGGNRGYLFRAMSASAAAIKVAHAIELAGCQSTAALKRHVEKLRREAESKNGSRASRQLAATSELGEVERLLEDADEHPKMQVVRELVKEQLKKMPSSKTIVFTNYRDSCDAVVEALSSIPGVKVSRLVGQARRYGDHGQRQDQQVQVLSELRNGAINVVVATCIGEEGLDVANTDLVIFYEPVPSEIRSIQRRGRTGRSRAGRVVVLVTAGTRDVTSLQAAAGKERAMHRNLERMKERKVMGALSGGA